MKNYHFMTNPQFLIGLLLAAHLFAAETDSSRSVAASINRIADEYYEDYLKLFPIIATYNGDYRYNDRLTIEISEKHRAQQGEVYRRYQNRLRQLDRARLSPDEQITYDVLENELAANLQELRYDLHLLPIRQMFSLPIEFPVYGSGTSFQPFRNTKDYDDFLKRLSAFPGWVDTAIENCRVGAKKGIVQPKIVIEKTLPQLDAIIVTDPETSIFYKPIRNFPAGIENGERERLARQYKEVIANTLLPAYRKLRDFARDEYLPHCRETVGFSALPDGKECYRHLVKRMTTTDLTPAQIFELGNNEVKRIQNEMEELRKKDRFDGTLRKYALFLRAMEPGFATKDDLTRAYNGLRTRIESKLPDYFGMLAKAPFDIRPVEEFREASAPAQYSPAPPDGSRPGIFYYNGLSLKEGPQPVSEAIFLHEAVPGHHFQFSIAREQSDIPRYRRFARIVAYLEGWGLYAESLGPELGLYENSYQKMDALSAEMWRARRLVVDTGLHSKDWTRQQAINYMLENPVQILPAELEVDRYIAMPGQALAYKIGALRIRALRTEVQKKLGAHFDIRAFHNAVLKNGGMPLTVLENSVRSELLR